MKRGLLAAMTLMVLGTVATWGLQAQEAGEPRRGVAVARANCAACHAVERGERWSPNPFAPPFQHIANLSGMTAIALNHLMHSSHETMPLIMLAPDEQWHLVAYIISLRARPARRKR